MCKGIGEPGGGSENIFWSFYVANRVGARKHMLSDNVDDKKPHGQRSVGGGVGQNTGNARFDLGGSPGYMVRAKIFFVSSIKSFFSGLVSVAESTRI